MRSRKIADVEPIASGRARTATCLLLLGVLSASPPADAVQLRLTPALAEPPAADPNLAWRTVEAGEGSLELTAPGHPLAPRLGATRVELDLPGAGTLSFTPLGLSSASVPDVLLARGAAVLGPDEAQPGRALVSDAWRGVDELYILRATELRHVLRVGRAALEELHWGDLVASWLVETPPGVSLSLEPGRGVVLRSAEGAFLARIPAPIVSEGDGAHWIGGVARWELGAQDGRELLRLVTPAAWARHPARRLPLLIDPSVSLEPTDPTKAGFVDEFGSRSDGTIVSGSLLLAGFGFDVRGFTEFDTSLIPDGASIGSVYLEVWLANHGNPGSLIEPVPLPLDMEVHELLSKVDVPASDLHDAIGGFGSGLSYVTDTIEGTGDDFCPEAFELRDYDLGPDARGRLQAQLVDDYFSIGFASSINIDPDFDHIDYIGYYEEVIGISCMGELPDSRITLFVSFSTGGCAPRNHGYWHRYCLGQGVIDPGRHGHGGGPGPKREHDDLPPDLLDIADAAMAPHGLSACQALDEGPLSDPLLAALRELATIHLNLAGQKLDLSCDVELHPVVDAPDLIVADAIALMEERIADGSVLALHEARWIGEHVVNGEALIRE